MSDIKERNQKYTIIFGIMRIKTNSIYSYRHTLINFILIFIQYPFFFFNSCLPYYIRSNTFSQ